MFARSSSLRLAAKYTLPVAFSFAVATDYLTRTPASDAAAAPAQDIIAIPHNKQFFDPKGFPTKVMVSTSSTTKTPMALAATGMRRKNFYITEVDVYQVGMYVSNESLKTSKQWNATDKSTPLVDSLIVPVKSLKQKPDCPRVMMILKFVRNVSNDKISEAFNETFSGLNPDSIRAFKDGLNKANASGTIQKGEELSFVWLEDQSLAIAQQGILTEVINTPDLAKRLLNVYLDPKRAVSPELVSTLGANIEVIDAQDLFGY